MSEQQRERGQHRKVGLEAPTPDIHRPVPSRPERCLSKTGGTGRRTQDPAGNEGRGQGLEQGSEAKQGLRAWRRRVTQRGGREDDGREGLRDWRDSRSEGKGRCQDSGSDPGGAWQAAPPASTSRKEQEGCDGRGRPGDPEALLSGFRLSRPICALQ